MVATPKFGSGTYIRIVGLWFRVSHMPKNSEAQMLCLPSQHARWLGAHGPEALKPSRVCCAFIEMVETRLCGRGKFKSCLGRNGAAGALQWYVNLGERYRDTCRGTHIRRSGLIITDHHQICMREREIEWRWVHTENDNWGDPSLPSKN